MDLVASLSPTRPGGPAFVGREGELERLVGVLADLEEGGGNQALLLAGDAGVGKTRLLTELRDRARTRGWQVVAGHCLDFADSALPYLPFTEILGRLAATQPEVVERALADHPGLGRLQPGRRVRSAESPDDSPDGAALDRGGLVQAVHALLEDASQVAPLLLVVEDAHWADQSTRELLSFLFARPVDGRVLLVVSYRSDDLHRRHPLRRQVAEWSRIHNVERIQLDPLDETAVRRLVRALHPDPLTETTVADIVRRSEGNAFFVEELVGATRAGDDAVPDDLVDLLLVRLDRLDGDAQTVVRAAAVAGRRVPHDQLAAVAALPDDRLEAALRTAVELHVLVPERSAYAFRHALLGEAVYEDLLPGERVRLHATYAAALRDRRAAGAAAELARHARLGQDPRTALLASIDAGDEAMRVGAPEEAAQHFEQALALVAGADGSGRGAPTGAGGLTEGVDVEDLVVRAAQALTAAGHVTRSVSVLRDHLATLDARSAEGPAAPPAARAQLLVALAADLFVIDTTEDPLVPATEAVALLGEDGPPQLRARALATRARLLAPEHPVASRQVALEALALAEKHDLPRLATDVVTTLAGIDKESQSDEVLRSLEDVVARARRAGAVNAEVRGLYFLGRIHQDRADFKGAVGWFSRGVQRAAVAGIPWAPYAFECRFMHAATLLTSGDPDGALELVDVAGQSPPPLIEGMLTAIRALVLAQRGDPAAHDLARLHRHQWKREGLIAIYAAPAEIEVHEQRRDPAAALAVYETCVATLAATWREDFHARLRLAALVVGTYAGAATAGPAGAGTTLGAEDRRAADEVVRRLVAEGDRVVGVQRESGLHWGPEGVLWTERLHAEHLRWRWAAQVDPPAADELVAAWRRTEEAAEASGNVYELARVRLRLVEVLRAAGDADAARAVGDLAREAARRLGAQPVLDALTALGAQPRRAAGASGSGGSAAAGAAPALTPRETEILALVAAGRSNGEIGRQLFISTKTVSVHVSNILGKLGAAGRTEAAALARRDGLV